VAPEQAHRNLRELGSVDAEGRRLGERAARHLAAYRAHRPWGFTALAAVATIGYLGLLAGPPLIGLTAHVTSLPVALGLVSAFCAAIGVGGRALVPAVIHARSAPS